MEHFFRSVGTLMSEQLRYCIERSLEDFVEFLEQYGDGNDYEGEYNVFRGLGLPTRNHPLRVFVVSKWQYLNRVPKVYPVLR